MELQARLQRGEGRRHDQRNGATQIAVGVDYSLSKRTALYANYSHIDNDGNSTFRVIGASPGIDPGGTSQGVQAGVRHSF